MTDISVIILVGQEKLHIGRCLDKLAALDPRQVFVVTSQPDDGTESIAREKGATVVDALAHGKPVITSTKTPWKVAQEKGCGWWVENDVASLARTLREMMGMPDDERRMVGDRGRPLVEEGYSWSAVGRKIIASFRSTLSLV